MKTILRFLKPHKITVIFIALILFLNAMCDLWLPKIMSNIVNVGLQQNGIEHAAPEAINQECMNFIKIFMPTGGVQKVNQAYTQGIDGNIERQRRQFLKDGKPLYGDDIKIYYKNNHLTQTELNDLDIIFSEAGCNFLFAMQEYATVLNIEPVTVSNFKMTDFYNLQTALEDIPYDVMERAQSKTNQMDEQSKLQTGIVFAGTYLAELGIAKGTLQSKYIWNSGLFMLLIALLSGLCALTCGFLIARVSSKLAFRMRRKVFAKVLTFSNNEFDNLPPSTLITRATNDVTQIQNFLSMGMRMLLYAPIMIVGGIILAYHTAASMSWIIALSCGIVGLLGLIGLVWVVPKFRIMQSLVDKINLIIREHLTGIMVIRAFANSQFEKKRFDVANKKLSDNLESVGKRMSTLFPFLLFVMNAISLLIIWIGAWQISQSTVQVGDMMAFMQYSMQIVMSFMFLSMMFFSIPRAMVSGERINEILTTEPVVHRQIKSVKVTKEKSGLIVFKNVSFRYNGADTDALSDISFTAYPGQTTAIIGTTGAGKTTLANLLLRFYDPTSGIITLGGINIKRLDLTELRNNIGYVPQKAYLFSGDIESNMEMSGKNLTDEQFKNALSVSQSMEFVVERAKNNEDNVSQGGSNFSGGQRQRLSIARAIAKDAPIYLFDDAFSALDMKTDRTLRAELKKNLKNRTFIIIAQRISTIKDAEQIIVIDEGRIIGKGTHSDLLKNCKEYKEIAETQGEVERSADNA